MFVPFRFVTVNYSNLKSGSFSPKVRISSGFRGKTLIIGSLMTQLNKAIQLLDFYKSNGFLWSSSTVLEPLGRVMYELGRADVVLEPTFDLLEDFRPNASAEGSAQKQIFSNDLRNWLDLEISQFNPVLRMAIYCLWAGLESIITDSTADYNHGLIRTLKRRQFQRLKLFLPTSARIRMLTDLIDTLNWSDFDSNLPTSPAPSEYENFCTLYIERFLNQLFKDLQNLNRLQKSDAWSSANGMTSVEKKFVLTTRQKDCLTLLNVDSELELNFLASGISNSQYQNMFGCNRMAAKRDLQTLIKIKKIRLADTARGRSTRYVLGSR